MSDDLVKRLRGWVRDIHEGSTALWAMDQDLKAAADRIEELEAKIRTYEQRDGMDGAVVSAIRDLLNHHNVPKAAFIDDHVGNAIWQRNVAKAKLAKAVKALRGWIDFANAEGMPVLLSDLEAAELKGQDDE